MDAASILPAIPTAGPAAADNNTVIVWACGVLFSALALFVWWAKKGHDACTDRASALEGKLEAHRKESKEEQAATQTLIQTKLFEVITATRDEIQANRAERVQLKEALEDNTHALRELHRAR